MGRLLLIRHGESEGNRDRVFCRTPDVPLTEEAITARAQWKNFPGFSALRTLTARGKASGASSPPGKQASRRVFACSSGHGTQGKPVAGQ